MAKPNAIAQQKLIFFIVILIWKPIAVNWRQSRQSAPRRGLRLTKVASRRQKPFSGCKPDDRLRSRNSQLYKPRSRRGKKNKSLYSHRFCRCICSRRLEGCECNRMKGMNHEDHLKVSGTTSVVLKMKPQRPHLAFIPGFREAKTRNEGRISMKDDLRHG